MKLKHLLFTLASLFVFMAPSALHAQSKAKGDATYYGQKFHGRRTSDGSVYHRDSLTCAHRTLPFGTLLKVRNTKNGREVIVKVTDRGPFRRGGIVDLSLAAAKEIDMVSAGVVPVEIETVANGASMALVEPAERPALPELQLLDPASGNYYTMTEWIKLGQEAREKAKANDARRRRTSYLADTKAKKPTWRVLNDSMTAKVGK